ncbi:dUTP diphosphatase [Cytobacillus oceanisediminis]|uniref:dUTP diphosphatase n=1 Tax=Cytobacillus oceanisediminis TaxID=665099 RepID=UPI00203EE169|nr:dUTP diphosphatase [Cytobacillus oceanisediminis]MCM3241307.1 dUTP diphosphatase [Cytobacillus oceanisediminis]
MNLHLLFKEQQLLRDKIAYDNPDRFEKLILALLVELGECANEWRGFKFWSKDQKSRTSQEIDCPDCNRYDTHMCCTCQGHGTIELGPGNPLLEEYVDGLHFVLELGIEQGITKMEYKGLRVNDGVANQFLNIYHLVIQHDEMRTEYSLLVLIQYYLGLGQMLGFTWEQIEQAYLEKNAINHERQEQGY